MTDSWCSLYGSRKAAWTWDGGKYIVFEQLEADGDTELETFGINSWYNEETCLLAVMLPDYREKEKKIEVTDLMKQQGIYVRSTGCWFFRVTEEQYEELFDEIGIEQTAELIDGDLLSTSSPTAVFGGGEMLKKSILKNGCLWRAA